MRMRVKPRSYRVSSGGVAVIDLGEGPLVEKKFKTIDELMRHVDQLKRKHRSKTVVLASVKFRTRLVPVK